MDLNLKELYLTPPSPKQSSSGTIVIPGTTQIKHISAHFHREDDLMSGKQCLKSHPFAPFVCTRPKGHTGAHEAHISNGQVCDSHWFDK